MSDRKWTSAQRNAIDAESGTVLVSAAAGSGKTSVLVERIIRILTDENCVSPEALLVVTFTNAAAAEMRGRVYSRIAEKAAKEKDKRKQYSLLSAKLSEMNVCTMDSFCMALVRENCHLLGIEADFSLLEAGECKKIKILTAKKVLEKRIAENNQGILQLLKLFERGKNDNNLIDAIIMLGDYSLSEPNPKEWLSGISQIFSCENTEDSLWGKIILRDVYSALEYCIKLAEGAVEDVSEDEELFSVCGHIFASDKSTLIDYYEKIKNISWDEKIEALRILCLKIRDNKLNSIPRAYTKNPLKLAAQEKKDTIKSTLASVCEEFIIKKEENIEDIKVLKIIADELIYIVKEYIDELLEAKKEKNAFDFPDISHFALSLLVDKNEKDQKTPLARELTHRFSEILIDEYQDTNRAQDTLFYSISKNGENMFFVGDVKQSIYRFRLASPEIFIEKCLSFPYYDGKEKKSKIILGQNFRSRKGILEAVNYFFSVLMSDECGEIEYNDDERLYYPFEDDTKDTNDTRLVFIESKGEENEVCEARYIAAKIKECIDKKVKVKNGDKQEPAKPSDFCILLRSTTNIVTAYIDELKAVGLPVSSDISQSFFEAAEIKTIVSYLRAIDNPGRDVDLAAVMLSPVFGFTYDDLAQLRIKHGKRTKLYTAVLKSAREDFKCEELCKKIAYFKKISACTPVVNLLREIYSDTAYLYTVGAMQNGQVRKNNLLKLLETADSRSENLSSFIRYLEILRESNSVSSNSSEGNGVRIMSMHKSKGLEFPFVFIAGTTKQFNKNDLRLDLIINHEMGFGLKRREPEAVKKYDTLSFLAAKKENTRLTMSEELRIYYVALTRAKQNLFIVIANEKIKENISKKAKLFTNISDIDPYIVKNVQRAADWFIMSYCANSQVKKHLSCQSDTLLDIPYIDVEYVENLTENSIVKNEELALYDEKTVAEIKAKAETVYAYSLIANSLSKHTASSLKEEHFNPINFGKSVPGFVYKTELTPADVGTATHKFLQYCDFEICKTNPSSECERLYAEGRLTEKQANAVDMEAIKEFVCSDIMKRIDAGEKVYREKQFTMLKSICEIDNSIPQEFTNEKSVVIGKIDLLFVENNQAVIIDYKTDKVNNTQSLVTRYESQMKLYAEAIEKSMKIKVKECILYSLTMRNSVSIAIK